MSITKVTLNINTKTYQNFKEYCKKKGLVLSRTIELFIEEKMKEE